MGSLIFRGQNRTITLKTLSFAEAENIPREERIPVYRLRFGQKTLAVWTERDDNFSIVEVPAPEAFVGRTLKQLELRPRLGLTLIAIKRQADGGAGVITNIAPSADETIRSGDVLALLGSNERLNQLDRLLTG